MESAGWRWIVITGVAGIAAGVNLGACTISEIPIGGDEVGQAGDDGSGSGGSDRTTGGTGGTGDTGGTSGSGGSGAGFSSCEEVRQATEAALAQIQACSSDAECGQVLSGTSCGCTRNEVARLDADTSEFDAIHYVTIDGETCNGGRFGSTCDCPAADGFACESNRCTWNYTPDDLSCDAQDARGVGSCEPHLGARWNGVGCEILWGCSCEGEDCNEIWPTFEDCAAARQRCFDNATCSDERKEMRDLLNANKTCTTTADCQTLYVGCGVTEDDCTGAVYANQSLDAELFDATLDRLNTCSTSFEGFGCANCERAARQAECIDGLCLGAVSCALEASAVGHFIGQNNACTEDDDCVQDFVGCEVTQDGCTGAVYLTAGFDDGEFKSLRDEYFACKGVDSCSACLRAISPPACVSGFCQHR